MFIQPCDTARGTSGLRYEDCAGGENSFLDEPSNSPCPICLRKEAFRQHTAQENIEYELRQPWRVSVAGESAHGRLEARRPSLFPTTVSSAQGSGFDESPPSSLLRDKDAGSVTSNGDAMMDNTATAASLTSVSLLEHIMPFQPCERAACLADETSFSRCQLLTRHS